MKMTNGNSVKVATLAMGLACSACFGSGAAEEKAECTATAAMRSPDGTELGTVTVSQVRHGALIRARLKGMPPGMHAMHLHETGACSPEFGAAGGHYNPSGAAHGYASAEGHHLGDLPNFSVAASGNAAVDMFVSGLVVCGGVAPLVDGDGAAVIVHRGEDDYATDPAGAAGDRIACGALVK